MNLEVIKNTKRNMLFGVFNKIIALICPFITRTAIQYTLGEEYLGLGSLFQSILTVLSLAELGFSSAIVYSMYKPVAEGDVKLVNALLNFYRKAYGIVGIVIIIIGLSLIPFLPHLITGTYPSDISLTSLYLVYLLNTVISYFMFAYMSSLIVVYQRDDINSSTNMIITILLTVIQLLLLFNFHDYMLFSLMMPVFTIINNVRIAIVVRRMFPQYHCEGRVPETMIGDMRKQIGGAFVSRVCQVARNSFDSICISAFIGLSMTAIYNNYFYIIQAVSAFVLIISTALNGGIGNHVVTRSKLENYKELKEIDFVFMWVSGWCTVCILCLSQPFMQLWMGKKMMLSDGIVVMLSAYFYLLRIGDMRTIYQNVNGLWWQNRYRSIIEAIANILLNIILAKLFGIYGIVSATIITLLFIHTFWGGEILFKYYFGLDYLKNYFKYHAIYALITAGICILMWMICSLLPSKGLVNTLFMRAGVCLFIPNIIYIIIYRNHPGFVRIKSMLFR